MLLATKRDKPMGLYSLAAVAGHNAKRLLKLCKPEKFLPASCYALPSHFRNMRLRPCTVLHCRMELFVWTIVYIALTLSANVQSETPGIALSMSLLHRRKRLIAWLHGGLNAGGTTMSHATSTP